MRWVVYVIGVLIILSIVSFNDKARNLKSKDYISNLGTFRVE